MLKSSKRNTRHRSLRKPASESSDEYEEDTASTPLTPTKHASGTLVNVTPPKQKKLNDKLHPLTPSSLLNRLALSSPETPPETKIGFRNARKALHNSVPLQMPGREKEINDLHEFINTCTNGRTSASLYISGPPGTGKTAALSLILEQIPDSDLKKIFINCTAIKSSRAIYGRITKDLEIKSSAKTEKDYINALENHLTSTSTKKMILLILDEIDQLDSKNQSVLYTLFEWPSRINSKLILIGIANALDLTDRILPRLQMRCELKPKLMHFSPYTKQQIVEIFTDRLKEANQVFAPLVVQMLAGKVAAVSGDVRRALDIGRRVLELAERDSEAKENIQKVDLKQVVSVLNSVYGTSQNLNEDRDDAIPLQQRIIICSLLLIMKKARNKDVTVGKLHDVYRKVCQKKNLSVVDQAEFVGLCSLIETRGILKVVGKKEPRLHKISLQWDEDEIAAVLKDKQLLSSILEDDKCLGRL